MAEIAFVLLLLSLVIYRHWPFHGDLEEEVYIWSNQQVLLLEVESSIMVCRLQQSLYCLKRSRHLDSDLNMILVVQVDDIYK